MERKLKITGKQQFSPTGVETDGGAYKIVVMQKDL